MSRLIALCSVVLVIAAGASNARAEQRGRTLVVTMTNDPIENRINVYDGDTHALLQTLSTHGKGGVGGNARGVKQHEGELVVAVNNGSNTVAVFRRDGDSLTFDKVVSTTSAPVSVDFGNDHLYVAGSATVDSFALHQNTVAWLDGTTGLELAGGGVPPNGSTAQVGVINDQQLLVTLKTDPDPGTVDVVRLLDGAITGAVPVAVSAPAGSLTPFGFSVYPDGTAVITLAHSSQDGLFRNGAFVSVAGAGQAADCWMTRVGKYLFTANTGSKTISRLIGTGNNVFVDSAVAASIATGGAPADLDADAGLLGVIDHGAGQSHLSLFSYNIFGELTAAGTPITVGVANANGVAILSVGDRDRN
ncbi:MAG TPA: hypothetical protein VGY48_16085 [Vicinamibacterales bacterium]|jgi:hypothetical protein|nr:hypothetical protein [Vicinamibacterales bacterium]